MSSTSPAGITTRLCRQTLLLDADDTLWENNIYFERAIASFISYLDHRVHTIDEVREHLNVCERATIAAHGYGLQSFRRSLLDCFEQLSELPLTHEHHNRIASFVDTIASTQIELLPDVGSTVAELHGRHRLILVTKGNTDEQTDKLERSGLRSFFDAVEVLAEKNIAAYRDVVVRHQCDRSTSWMIGNSPKSDINPALGAGLNAVFIPHDCTWVLENEVVDNPSASQRFIELEKFEDLLQRF
jgi:putative hydrolase of the HAD superfamily